MFRRRYKNEGPVYTKIGSITYSIDKTVLSKFSKGDIEKSRYAILDEKLMELKNFYLDENAFMFKIYNYHLQGHKLLLRLNEEYAGEIDVYSMNFQEVKQRQENARRGRSR